MRFTSKTKLISLLLLIILNLILRLQASSSEIGNDSFLMHIMVNSLSEFGYAKWILHPLSFAGLYPYSYSSSMQFLLSGVTQSTSLDSNSVLFVYTVFLGFLSIFTGYLMADAIMDDDLFKIIVAFIFSTIPAIVQYTTWTMATRPLVIILTPLLLFLLIKSQNSVRYIILICILSVFLFVTHHIFYFILPILIVFFILFFLRLNKDNRIVKYSEKLNSLIPLIVFLFAISIPVIFRKFLEEGTRYASLAPYYIRYTGPLIIFSIGGIFYLTFKEKKTFSEWFLLLSIISLMAFIYETSYMKWFIPIFLTLTASISLINISYNFQTKKYLRHFFAIILILSIVFIGYYQFIHDYEESPYNARYIEDSTYNTGLWMKKYIDGSAISNDKLFSYRISSLSDTTHFLIPFTTIDQIYGFIEANVSLYKRYPLSSEEFWMNGYEGPDTGEYIWEAIHILQKSPDEFGIKYIVENEKGNGNIIWHHGLSKSKLIDFAHEKNLVYNTDNISIWYCP